MSKVYKKKFMKFTELFAESAEYLGALYKSKDNLPFAFGTNDYTLIAWPRFQDSVQDVINEHDFGYEILGRAAIQYEWEKVVFKVMHARPHDEELYIDLEG